MRLVILTLLPPLSPLASMAAHFPHLSSSHHPLPTPTITASFHAFHVLCVGEVGHDWDVCMYVCMYVSIFYKRFDTSTAIVVQKPNGVY